MQRAKEIFQRATLDTPATGSSALS